MTQPKPSRLSCTIELLGRLCGAQKAAAWDSAQAAIETPETGAKLFFGTAFFDHAEAATEVMARLASLAEIDEPRSAASAGLDRCAATKSKLLRYRDGILADMGALADALNTNLLPVSDDPTERLLARWGLTQARLETDVAGLIAACPGEGLPTVSGARRANGYRPPRLPAREPVFSTEGNAVNLGAPELPTKTLAIELMHANFTDLELTTIEICCRLALENPHMPWEFVRDMARQSWDECRHARSFWTRIESLGGRMGQRPTSFMHWEITRDQPLAIALCSHQMIGEWTGIDGALWFASLFRARGDTETADVFDFVARDECTHAGFGAKWLRHLAPSEAQRAELMETARTLRASFGKPSDGPVAFPFHRWACEIANYDLAEIDRLQARFDTLGSVVGPEPAARPEPKPAARFEARSARAGGQELY